MPLHPRILILTQYFPPETGAPQNRLSYLARYLHQSGIPVTVCTAMPNYPQMRIHEEFRGRIVDVSTWEGLPVIRTWLYVRRGGALVRLAAYCSFVLSSLLTLLQRNEHYDLILLESPPLFLGITAMVLAALWRAELVTNISDLWPESAEKLGIIKSRILLAPSERLEALLYRRSARISGQTQGIVSSIANRNGARSVFWWPNGYDFDRTMASPAEAREWRRTFDIADDAFVVTYTGLIGYAQGLHIMLDAAADTRNDKRIVYAIVGDGPERDMLMQRADAHGLRNLIFTGHVPVDRISGIIAASQVAVIPLLKSPLFRGAIPSKIFEPLAHGVPILLGVDGEARELFIDQGNCGLFYEPEDVNGFIKALGVLATDESFRMALGANGRDYVRTHFNREKLAEQYCRFLFATDRNVA